MQLLKSILLAQVAAPLTIANPPIPLTLKYLGETIRKNPEPTGPDAPFLPKTSLVYTFIAKTTGPFRGTEEYRLEIAISQETARLDPRCRSQPAWPSSTAPGTSPDLGILALGTPALLLSAVPLAAYLAGRRIVDRLTGTDAHERSLLAAVEKAVPPGVYHRIELAFRLRKDADMRQTRPVDEPYAESVLAGSRCVRRRQEQGRPHETSLPDRIDTVWIDEDGIPVAAFNDLDMVPDHHAKLTVHGSTFHGDDARRMARFGAILFDEVLRRDPCPCCGAKAAAAPPA